MRSWQTTVLGIAVIGGAVAILIWADLDMATKGIIAGTIAAIGTGLIRARDNGVTSKRAGAK